MDLGCWESSIFKCIFVVSVNQYARILYFRILWEHSSRKFRNSSNWMQLIACNLNCNMVIYFKSVHNNNFSSKIICFSLAKSILQMYKYVQNRWNPTKYHRHLELDFGRWTVKMTICNNFIILLTVSFNKKVICLNLIWRKRWKYLYCRSKQTTDNVTSISVFKWYIMQTTYDCFTLISKMIV